MTQSDRTTFELPFAKFQAVGNDFIVVSTDDIARVLGEPQRGPLAHLMRTRREDTADDVLLFDISGLARLICDRHTGVGADGLLWMEEPVDRRQRWKMTIYNADGSAAEMSGNGIRCAAAYVLDSARRQLDSQPQYKAAQRVARLRELTIETTAGVKSLQVIKAEIGRWVFRVGMGEPVLVPAKIPFRAGKVAAPIVDFPLPGQHGIVKVTVTSMGNPHCTVFVGDFDALDWAQLGREIESSELFPNRTNVEFVKVISRNEIEVRFWERGVGKTQSSGTGSCAAAVACVLNGLTGRMVRVQTLAGSLEVAWPEGREVTLTGPVELVARGTYYLLPKRGSAPFTTSS